jgi:Ca2+-transporting ATPase
MTNGSAAPPLTSGLSEAEAQIRLRSEGYNELARQDRRTPLRIVLEVLREPMLSLLVGAALFTFYLET